MTFPYPKCDPGTKLRKNKLYFGEFKCENCARRWRSGNSWLSFGQDCIRCGELTYPWKLSYLKAPPTDTDDIKKRHPQDKCERCRILGHYCRDSKDVNALASSSDPDSSDDHEYPKGVKILHKRKIIGTIHKRSYSATHAGPSASKNQQKSTISNYSTSYKTSSSKFLFNPTYSSSYCANSFSNTRHYNYNENDPEFKTWIHSNSNPYPKPRDVDYNCIAVLVLIGVFFVFWMLILAY